MPATRDYWPLVLENLRTKISGSSYKAWFSRLEFVSTSNQGRKLIIGVPSAFNKNYIESKFKSELRDAISKYYPQVIHIDYEIIQVLQSSPTEPVQQILEEISHLQGQEVDLATNPEKLSSYLPRKSLNNLNPKYTFENFVITGNNELAVSVCQSVINQPGSLYNPVFIYGGVGLGKTHLIQAVGQKMLEKNPSFNIKYIPCETFVNQFLLALQKRKMDEFREYYRSIDLLLVDDIQFIAGKEATQEGFFHTFNELHQLNKQIILTSDRAPKSLGGIEERLVSRFEWGMVVDISKPDLEDRISILQDKTDRLGLQMSSEQLIFVAARIDSNVRELEGVLNRIQAKLRLMPGQNLTDEILQTMVNDYLGKSPIQIHFPSSHNNTPDRILQAVCRLFGLSKADLLGASRQKNIALARQITFWFYKHELDLSYPTIGKLFGGRDHTTVMHGCNKIESLRQTDRKIQEKLALVEQTLLQV
jgi:chromosomal replication initiator protein